MTIVTTLKAAGLPKTSAKFAKVTKAPSIKTLSVKAPKVSAPKTFKTFDFSKFTKTKVPKSKKVALLKSKIKKNAGF